MGSQKITYTTSPEQRYMFNMLAPLYGNLMSYGLQQPVWDLMGGIPGYNPQSNSDTVTNNYYYDSEGNLIDPNAGDGPGTDASPQDGWGPGGPEATPDSGPGLFGPGGPFGPSGDGDGPGTGGLGGVGGGVAGGAGGGVAGTMQYGGSTPLSVSKNGTWGGITPVDQGTGIPSNEEQTVLAPAPPQEGQADQSVSENPFWSTAPTSLWNIPQNPSAPHMNGPNGPISEMSHYQNQGVGAPGVASYHVPSNANLLPSSNWYNTLSPQVMAGLNAPYDDARSRMLETMGAGGQGGSARGGWSGAAGAALGAFEGERANNIGLAAWEMTQPGLKASYNADLNRNIYNADWRNQYNATTYGNLMDIGRSDYSRYYQPFQQDYSMSKDAWGVQNQMGMMPYNLLLGGGANMMPSTFSNPVADPGGPSQTQQLMGLVGMGIGSYYGGPAGGAVGYGAGNYIGGQID